MSSLTILRRPAVAARTGLARSTMYKFIADGQFPKQIRLGPRCVGWLDADIDEWIQARISASRAPRR